MNLCSAELAGRSPQIQQLSVTIISYFARHLYEKLFEAGGTYRLLVSPVRVGGTAIGDKRHHPTVGNEGTKNPLPGLYSQNPLRLALQPVTGLMHIDPTKINPSGMTGQPVDDRILGNPIRKSLNQVRRTVLRRTDRRELLILVRQNREQIVACLIL